MFHADNAYFYPHATVTGHRCRTNLPSNTAFRGFGGPQGMVVAEKIMDDIARSTGLDPLDVRLNNLYGIGERNTTHYYQKVEHNVLPELMTKLEQTAKYRQRREDITAFNQNSPVLKRGLALTPVKFGISFTAKHLNQAGALVHIYTDGSIQLNHGGTEMGQGLLPKSPKLLLMNLPLTSVRYRSLPPERTRCPTHPQQRPLVVPISWQSGTGRLPENTTTANLFASEHFKTPASRLFSPTTKFT